jgi:hypothetical protein
VPLIFMTTMICLIRKSDMSKNRKKWTLIVLGLCVVVLLIMNITEFLW